MPPLAPPHPANTHELPHRYVEYQSDPMIAFTSPIWDEPPYASIDWYPLFPIAPEVQLPEDQHCGMMPRPMYT